MQMKLNFLNSSFNILINIDKKKWMFWASKEKFGGER